VHTQNMREEQARAVLRVREGETARAVALDIGRTHQTVLKSLSDAPKDKVHARDLRDLRTSLAAKVSMGPPKGHTKPTKAPPKSPKAPPFAQ